MSSSVPLDARGNRLSIGNFVCYTTNSRDSGLGFGIIRLIKSKPVTKQIYNKKKKTWERVPALEFRIQMDLTDAYGQPLFVKEWDDINQDFVATQVQSKSGLVIHSQGKFLRL